MPLSPALITEETIATLYDHLEGAAKTARKLLANQPSLSKKEEKELWAIVDGWKYCQKGLLNGETPERER